MATRNPAAASDAAKAPAKTAKKRPALSIPTMAGEDPWTAEEVEEIRAELADDVATIGRQIADAEAELSELMNEGGDGAGRDPADVGSANFEHDQQMSLAANLRDMLSQTERAIERLEAGVYGACEVCGEAIGKGRLQAFPRATMCVACKQREERR